ncbi:Rad17 cell cycle checkpoint protein-domain-containing protein [Fennellomyces sp. T-0311]|nr:Rad17 cell cycle checkpoint protein-domain-containing protein [Fennellomyces sp. T-0311]
MDPFYDQFVVPSYSTQQKKKNARPKPADRPTDVDPTRTDQLWVDKYEPQKESDLAIRPAKLKEVDACLRSSAFGTPPGPCKCLVLSGPAGSGKSTTIRTIAKARNYQIVEWNPVVHEQWDGNQDYESTMTKFENFVRRATQLQPLTDPNATNSDQRRIILLDDIPDLMSDTARSRFHGLIESHLSDPRPFLIVIIVSEAWMQTESRWKHFSETRLTGVRDVLSPALVDSPRCTVIEFNPITSSRLEKSLAMIQENEYRNTKHCLPKDQLSQIVERSHGDIRNAINTLQFHCIPPSPHIPMKRKRDNQDSMGQAGERGAPLDLFHALGKVLYAKRDPQGKFESRPEDILRLLPVDSDLFVAYLQENMLKYFNDMSSCFRALDWLCEADSMRSSEEWMVSDG